MDLSKALGCVPHDLLMPNLHAYGLDTVTFLFTYLKERKQKVSINNIFSLFEIILSGVPQDSKLGPILFHIYSFLILWLKNSDIHNLADDNIIAVSCNILTNLCQTLENESESGIDWFKNNSMIANPDKFQAIILSKIAADVTHKLSFYETTKSVKLLGVEIDYQITSNEHISTLFSKAAMQLNALYRLQKHMGKTEKNSIISNFIYTNFSYYSLVWHFCSC